MPTEITDNTDIEFSPAASRNGSVAHHEQWESLRKRVVARADKADWETIFGKSAKQGQVYRWGVAVACGGPCDEATEILSRLACGGTLGKARRGFDLAAAAEAFMAGSEDCVNISTADAVAAVRWAAALPSLCATFDPALSWRLIQALCELRESIMQRNDTYSPTHLILGGELGLTLAARLADVPSCKRLHKSSLNALSDWCEQCEEAVAAAVAIASDTRLVLASLIRCRRIIEGTSKRKFRKQHVAAGDLLATWVAALTLHTGGSAFSTATRKHVSDDLGSEGLLAQATEFDPESLRPAMAAALGADQSGGRLAWEVSLPETMWHEPDAKVAVLLPEWDVRRGRTHLDYSGEETQLELFAGRSEVIAGNWQANIEIDGQQQQPLGGWSELCEYTDDDVHYLELEQTWSGGVLLQRQVMLLRDDRCVLLADAVVPDKGKFEGEDVPAIRYTSRLPLAVSMGVEHEPETREIFVSDGRRRGLVIPLSASEWNVGPTRATLNVSEDRHLVLQSSGKGRLYTPLWFDFQQRRFKRKRTWRQLTVGDQLRVCRPDEAVGYRVQIGSEHWMLYRSLGDRCCRTLLGRHLIADFYASRFDPSDGSHEDLVTVDDRDSFDD